MFHDSNLRRIAAQRASESRMAKLVSQEAACRRLEKERARRDQRFVADWQARFHAARNAACEGQKNFRGIA